MMGAILVMLIAVHAIQMGDSTVITVQNGQDLVKKAEVFIQTLDTPAELVPDMMRRFTEDDGTVTIPELDPKHRVLLVVAILGDNRGTTQISVKNGAFPRKVTVSLKAPNRLPVQQSP